MVPPANGSFCRGSENQPAGRRPAMSVRICVVRSMRAFSSSRETALTSSCLKPCAATSCPRAMSDLIPGRVDLGRDRRHGEGRLEAVLGERRQHEIEPLARPERGRRAADVAGRDPLRSAGDAQIDDDVNRAALSLRPAHLRVGQALLIGDGVAVFPRHGPTPPIAVTPRCAWADACRGNGAPPPRRSQTTRPAASSCAR